ncbi:uncharacterized protein G2W53_035241 [Senna tora]|uniref:Uncharacterized protein n=1 Tax=Senna tora TaxID=362788 RepID=A0A834SSH7_9FABA|nr:uncharacterized protein G2W53_035241 [Senna tora]
MQGYFFIPSNFFHEICWFSAAVGSEEESIQLRCKDRESETHSARKVFVAPLASTPPHQLPTGRTAAAAPTEDDRGRQESSGTSLPGVCASPNPRFFILFYFSSPLIYGCWLSDVPPRF